MCLTGVGGVKLQVTIRVTCLGSVHRDRLGATHGMEHIKLIVL